MTMGRIAMTTILDFLLFFPVLAATGQTAQSESTSPTEQELRELTRRWDEAVVRRDANIMNRILSDDYTFAGTPKSEYLAFLKTQDIEYKTYERSDITARIYGDTALLFGRASVSGKSPDVYWFDSTFNFMDVWIKQQGQWKCVATMHDHIQGTTSRDSVRFGPDVKASLVIVFKSDATDEQVGAFWRNVLQVPDQSGRGHRFREGISSTLNVSPIDGHHALAVQFQEDAPQGQKEEIKSRIKRTPLVYKLFENVAPTNVKLK